MTGCLAYMAGKQVPEQLCDSRGSCHLRGLGDLVLGPQPSACAHSEKHTHLALFQAREKVLEFGEIIQENIVKHSGLSKQGARLS